MEDTWRNTIPAYGKTLEDEDGRYRVSPLALFLALYFLYKFMYLG